MSLWVQTLSVVPAVALYNRYHWPGTEHSMEQSGNVHVNIRSFMQWHRALHLWKSSRAAGSCLPNPSTVPWPSQIQWPSSLASPLLLALRQPPQYQASDLASRPSTGEHHVSVFAYFPICYSPKQAARQTVFRNQLLGGHKVEDADCHTDLRREVRVRKLGCDVQPQGKESEVKENSAPHRARSCVYVYVVDNLWRDTLN